MGRQRESSSSNARKSRGRPPSRRASSSSSAQPETPPSPRSLVDRAMPAVVSAEVGALSRNQRTAHKWAERMKQSIAKKASARRVFAKEPESLDELRARHDELRAEISQRLSNVRSKCIVQLQRSDAPIARADPAPLAYAGVMESKGAALCDKYCSVARDLGALRKTVDARSEALESTLELVLRKMPEESASDRTAPPPTTGLKHSLRSALRSP